ncbi:MAG: carboxylate--amine ligase [Bacteroidia bacterium]|nr:carboxylate--amine ligase [Bacteroidia bacterium]MDW8134647.1 carboxylate--amine ligase [Bacteroidia bacterium]
MVWLFISPEFPPNYHLFAWHFQKLGGTAIGIGGVPFHELPPQVAQSLNFYVGLEDLHDTEKVIRTAYELQNQVGKIEGVDSFNEYWLPLEATIREALNIPGPRPSDLPTFQQKSQMKLYFQKAGIEPIPGKVAQDLKDVGEFIAEHGLPIIAKPDKGVGASSTVRIGTIEELRRFQTTFRPGYLLEKFITGTIQTYDGLVDREGRIVFSASLEYSRGIAEVVNQDTDLFYFVQRDIPDDLAQIGPRIVEAYGLKMRFFHFEFIRSSEGRIYPLEVNMRPPGYPTLDLFDFAHDIDLYYIWAACVLEKPINSLPPAHYYTCYIARKNNIGYEHSHEAILRKIGSRLLYHAPTNPLFRAAMGDYHYVIRTPDFREMIEIADYIHKRLTL